MFRDLRRIKQKLSEEECIRLLKTEKRGVLSLLGDDGYPYGIPMNFHFDEKENKLIFHCAKTGHKLDSIKKCSKASFCVFNNGEPIDGTWALKVESVVIFGKIKVVEDEAVLEEICRKIAKRFTEDKAYVDNEIKTALSKVCCLELEIEHISGKSVRES